MANIPNKQFYFIFSEPSEKTRDNSEQHLMTGKPHRSDYDITISCRGVQKLLENLNPHKQAGPDNIKPQILKRMQP